MLLRTLSSDNGQTRRQGKCHMETGDMNQGNLGATRNKKASCFLDPVVGCHPADASVVPVVSRTESESL